VKALLDRDLLAKRHNNRRAAVRWIPKIGRVDAYALKRTEFGRRQAWFDNRRFWPVRCGSIDLDALARDRDQLWAEAVARYRGGAIWWLDEPELVASAKSEQDERYHADAWDGRIDRWLVYERRRVNHGYGNYDDWREEEVERPSPLTDTTVGEILEGALGIEPARWTRADQMRVTAYLKARNWERYQVRKSHVREWRYRRQLSG
jgi:predicted P-loop ATPase